MHLIAPTPITNEIGFTRPSPKWVYDRTGTLVEVPANTLGVTYDPADLSKAPWALIEPAAAQLLRYTDELNNAAAYGGSQFTIAANATTAPNGAMAADRLSASADAAFHHLDQEVFGRSYVDGEKYTFSVFARADTISRIRLDFYYSIGGRGGFVAAFNLITGAIDGGDAYIESRGAKIQALPGGWFRCSMVGIVSQATDYPSKLLCRVVLLDANGNGSYAGVNAPGAFMWGWNLTPGDKLSSYIASGATPLTRAADVVGGGAGLLYSNLVESDSEDAPLWVSGAAVPKAGLRRRATTHRIYRALQAIPTTLTATPESDPRDSSDNPYWLEWEPTNRWAALDTALSTASTGMDVVQWVVRPNQVTTALAVLNIDSFDVRVSQIEPGGQVVYQATKLQILKTSRTIVEFLTKPIERRRDEVFMDMPAFKTGLICITATKPGSVVSVGDIKMGRLEEIGDLLVEPEIRRLRRSIIKDDGYGRYKFNKRPSSKLLSCIVDIDASRADAITTMIDKYTDDLCVLIGDDRFTSLIILGFVQDFRLSLAGGDSATYNLQAEGVG